MLLFENILFVCNWLDQTFSDKNTQLSLTLHLPLPIKMCHEICIIHPLWQNLEKYSWCILTLEELHLPITQLKIADTIWKPELWIILTLKSWVVGKQSNWPIANQKGYLFLWNRMSDSPPTRLKISVLPLSGGLSKKMPQSRICPALCVLRQCTSPYPQLQYMCKALH